MVTLSASRLVAALAKLLIALGGLTWALGRDRQGQRLVVVGIVLVATQPLVVGGLTTLLEMEVPDGRWPEHLAVAAAVLFVAAVVLAGCVALRRRARPGGVSPTSHKKRGEPGL